MDRHFVATAYVFDEEMKKMVFVHNKKLDSWLPPGGHLEQEEIPSEGALREVKEETGLDAEIVGDEGFEYNRDGKAITLRKPFIMLLEEIGVGRCSQHMDFIFVAKTSGKELRKQEKEIHDVKWVSPSELDSLKPMFENARVIASHLFKKYSGEKT